MLPTYVVLVVSCGVLGIYRVEYVLQWVLRCRCTPVGGVRTEEQVFAFFSNLRAKLAGPRRAVISPVDLP